MSEQIQRFVFKECEKGNHTGCRVWDAGEIDGVLRAAGLQCSCQCHVTRMTRNQYKDAEHQTASWAASTRGR